MPYTSPRELAANAVLALLALVAQACHPAPEGPLTALLRPKGTGSTAALPRARIGLESRFVLATHPAFSLHANEIATLPAADELALDLTLPDAVGDHAEVRLDGWLSIRDQTAVKNAADLMSGARLGVRATPAVVRRDGGAPPRLHFALPEAVRGQVGRLTVRARPLPPALERLETEPITVPANARLVFGYGVEEAGWDAGWPPVRFRVLALSRRGAPAVVFENVIDPAAREPQRGWQDATTDLAALAGRRVTFQFETQALGGGAERPVTSSFPLIANPEVVARPRAPAPPRRNVILISLDTLRARSVGAYGCPEATTPALDQRVAFAGALVRQVVTPVPFTPPAHMSMLTGLAPCAHGVFDLNTALAPGATTLAEALRAGGWETAAFTEDAYLVDGNGFERGFDAYSENRSEESASPGFAQETFGAATRWLAGHGDRPFFLFVHTYQVHEPYNPRTPYDTMFPGHDDPNPNRRNRALYEGEVRYTDDVVLRFLNVLEARRLAERTILVVTSDHGEAFGEHFWGGHGFDLHDEALLVPLLVRAPGLVPAGRVVEDEVGLADLLPTLLELVGLPAPTGIEGRSFAGLLTGQGRPFVERPIVSWIFGDAATAVQISVRTRGYKYIKQLDSGTESFVDLGSDPGETVERLGAGGIRLDEARAVAARALAACAEDRKRHPADAVGMTGGEPGWLINRDELQNRDQIERKLRSLGYVR